ncbi:MAG: Hsp20/alpha crystallin family protein [Thermofilum sp.]|jgi:HSP20 family protein|nr:Hsp20/alpha crystallin family protein [Thermofilum sp.]
MEEKLVSEMIETLARMEREVEKMFRDLWTRLSAEVPLKLEAWEPPADVIDAGEELVVYVDVPGFSKENIKVKVTEDYIEIVAQKSAEKTVTGTYLLRQRFRESLYKKIVLPVKVRPEQAKARLENGVLEIRVPKISVAKEVQVSVE